MASFVADALSRKDLLAYGEYIRKAIGWGKPCLDVIRFLEHVLPEIDESFNYEIVSDKELPGMEGRTLPGEHLIQLPENVYYSARRGEGRARFTVIHEIGHYLLIDKNSVALCRANERIPAYRDPEWQANTLASALLMPPSLTAGMSQTEIASVFGVSAEAARVHLDIKKKECLP